VADVLVREQPAAPTRRSPRAGRPSHRKLQRRSRLVRYGLRTVVIVYLIMLVGWPLTLVAQRALGNGLDDIIELFQDPQMMHAFKLTIFAAVLSVLINTVFGVAISILLVRYEFPGKRILNAFVDLPLAVSPIVVGLSLVLVYNARSGWFGPTLESSGFKVMYAFPAIVMATTFVALPLVIREVVPVLQEVGTDQEQAARSLGANAFQRFRRITLPTIKWAVIYGMVLTLARSLGEFGAVKVVSGNVLGVTRTATLAVEEKYLNFDKPGAYATAFLLALVSVACIIVVSLLRPKDQG
jgi:sulfate/thiosulfate transport system permease protein